MIIGGFQKFSLLEYPGQICAVIFTQGCNFRCPYCHNPGLVDPARFSETISEESIYHFLELRQGKLDAVTISGGEPTIQPDLIRFLLRIKSLGYKIKLDTNGSLPDVLEHLIEESLVDYWAMDVKAPLTLYSTISGCPVDDEQILRSMNLIRKCGKEWEFRTTYFNQVMNWNDVLDIQALLQPGDRYYLQQCKYENTLEPIVNPHHSHVEMLFNQELTINDKKSSHHYQSLKETGKLQQITVKMR
jgi:pyruvate formate lyase activating enzyme